MKKTVAIVIPVYKQTYTPSEILSLNAWKKYLSSYDTFIIAPTEIKPPIKTMKSMYFDASYFTSIRKYSQLLLSTDFYEAFRSYKYILVYQLDALVFSDQLSSWCKMGWDYIGAPWTFSLIGRITNATQSSLGGNGGFSLRQVKSCLSVLKKTNREAKHSFSSREKQIIWFGINILLGRTQGKWLECPATQYPFNEDGFWSFEAKKYIPSFKLADREISGSFAHETDSLKQLKENRSKLPFGVHAWEKYDKTFWLKQIKANHL